MAGSGRPPVARCGGPALCSKCAIDAEQLRAKAANKHVTNGLACWCDPIVYDYGAERADWTDEMLARAIVWLANCARPNGRGIPEDVADIVAWARAAIENDGQGASDED